MSDAKIAPPPQQPGVSKLALGIIVVLVLLLGAAATAALFFAGVVGQPPAAAYNTEAPPMMPARPPLYLPLDPPLVVNIDRQGRIGFLQVTVQLMTRDPLVKEAVELHMPVIRNNLLMLLSSKNYEQLMSVEGKQALRQEALNEINRVLETRMVPGRIEDLYFTGFVMQ